MKETRGGFRKNAGRPKGAKNLAQANFKKTIKEIVTPNEALYLVSRLVKWAKTDKKIAMFLAEQIYGKAKSNQAPESKANNIAIFLDNLEKQPRLDKPDNIIEGHGQAITRKKLETTEFIFDQGQEPGED